MYTSTGIILLVGAVLLAVWFFVVKPETRRMTVTTSAIVVSSITVIAAAWAFMNHVYNDEADRATETIRQRSGLTVGDVGVYDHTIVIHGNACTVRYRFNAYLRLPDGTLWPLVPGTAENIGGHPHCRNIEPAQLDQMFIHDIKKSSLWRK